MRQAVLETPIPHDTDNHQRGLYHKFNVTRADSTDQPGGKHHGDEYFVLNLTTDLHAIPAIAAYAESCAAGYPLLAADLQAKIAASLQAASEFITVPETTLPSGIKVPAFQVARYPASRGPSGIPMSVADAEPWVRINYHEAREACAKASYGLLTETQALAIAWNASQQEINWTGGKVGEGKLYMGLHKNSVSSAQPGKYESTDLEERTWLQISNGERIYHFAGNLFSWIFDDIQGDENGLVAKAFAEDSPSLTTAPYPSMEKGMGWRPAAGANWSGYALIRGGGWYSGADAGAFYLYRDWPGYRDDDVGFRCTQSIGL